MRLWERYRLRLRRKRLRFRAFRKRRELTPAADRTATIGRDAVLLVTVLRNERVRLPFFLRYYRNLGIRHSLVAANGSDDGSPEELAAAADMPLWTTRAS